MEADPEAGGLRPVLDGAGILARAPGVHDIAELEAIDWGLVPASHLGFGKILELTRAIEVQQRRAAIDGVVVVQGTDTLEETAFAFDLLLRSDKPLVVTGAMRTPSSPEYDGARNLADAVACATSDELRGVGAVVVMGGLVIGADQAVKADSTAIDAFRARDGQPLGTVVEGRVVINGGRSVAHRAPRARIATVPLAAVEDVYLVTAVTGLDGAIVRGLAALQPRGLVVAATGSGNTHPDLLAAAGELMATGTVVCLTTRCAGGTVDPIYAFLGGGATWQQAGALMSRFDGPKTRVALALALAAGWDAAAIGELIAP